MRDAAVLTTPSRFPSGLKRVLAGALSTMLAAGGLVAVSVAAPVVEAPSANAAANFVCGAPGSPQLYLTSNVANERRIFQLDANSGSTTLAYAPNPAIAAGTLNQLATSRDGTQMFWTNGATETSTIYEYTPGNDGSAGVLETTPRGAAAATGNTMGGFDLATNRFVFGGATFVPNGTTNLVVHSYNPAGNAVSGSVATIALPNAAGGNGDLAFAPTGTMYVVTGGNASQNNSGVDAAQIYRVTGGIPTTGTANLTAVPLGGRIDSVRGLNSIAFGSDGYLYLFGTNPANAAAQLIKVNPSNGDIVSRTSISGATTGATDFASCASPSTVRGEVTLDEPRKDPNDQFQVVIGGGGLRPTDPSTTGTTTGSGTTVDNNPVTGPVMVLPGDTVTVEQRPAPGSTTPGTDYAQEWVCRDTAYGNRVVSSGFGPQASFTMPQNQAVGSNVLCSFSTQEAVSSATIDKTWVDNGPITAIGQRIDYRIVVTNTGNVPLQELRVTDPAPGLTVTCPPGSSTLNPLGTYNTVNTVTCTATRAATASDFQGSGPVSNTATASYRTQQPTPDGQARTMQDSADFTPDRSAPAPVADSSTGNAVGTPVTVDVVGNDGNVDSTSVTITGAPGDGKRLEVPGQGVWTVDPQTGAITFTPEPGFTGSPDPITYSVAGPNGVRAESTVTVTYAAQAQPHRDDDNAPGSTVSVPVLSDVVGDVQPGSLRIVTGPGANDVATSLVVPEGTWSVVDDRIVFTPNEGVTTDPAPIEYQVVSADGTPTRSTVTVTYQPVANPDTTPKTQPGSAASVAPLANDQGTIDPATFAFLDEDGEPILDPATGAPATSVTIPGEGTWSFEIVGGELVVTFEPQAGFVLTPTPIGYQVAGPGPDRTPTQSTISAPYLPQAAADQALLQPLTEPATPVVVADILGNDAGALDPASVQLFDPAANGGAGAWLEPGAELVVPGEGTWEVVRNDDGTVDVRFTAADGFQGDPTPIRYRVADAQGDQTEATITVTFQPVANPDAQGGFALGTTATLQPLTNDLGALDPSTFTFLDGAGAPVAGDYEVAGQGTWSFTVVDGVVTVSFAPATGFVGDPAPVGYAITDAKGVTVTSTITFDYDSLAADDESLDNPVGSTVTLPDVLGNDDGVFDPATFAFVPAGSQTPLAPGASYEVDGEGTWSIVVNDDGTVDVIFEPAPGFESDPTPVRYVVQDLSGTRTGATITVDYLQIANADAVLLAPLTNPATAVTVEDILGNDLGALEPASVQLFDRAANDGMGAWLEPGATLTVDGEGAWEIRVQDDGTVDVVFTAQPGFQGDPTPIRYRVQDAAGDLVDSTITVTFQPVANPDARSGFAIGTAATVTPLTNDLGAFDPATFTFVDDAGQPVGAGQPYATSEGTWTIAIDAESGVVTVTFEPADGFEGDPAPVGYAVTDRKGVTVQSTITVDYQPAAADDAVSGIVPGTVARVVDVLANDAGVLDPATFAFVPAGTQTPLAPGASYEVDGEGVWSIEVDGDGVVTVVFTPADGFLSDPTPVRYVVDDASGSRTGATVTVDYLQTAADDARLDQPITQPVTVEDILGNDVGDFLPASVQLFDPATQSWLAPGAPLEVAGEGTWTIVVQDDGTVDVRFEPLDGYLGDPTPVRYQVADAAGDLAQATITVSYLPVANDDESLANAFQSVVTVDVLANDVGDFVPGTVRFVDAAGVELEAGQSLVVAGEGTWSIDSATGAVTFTPEPGYGGDPTPVTYRVTDSTGDTAEATIRITYGPTAVDDQSLRNAQGTTVTVDVLANDLGQFDPASVRIVSGDQLVTELVVAGEGTWRVDPATGAIAFSPASGFTGNPTPIAYRVNDVSGDTTGATVTITYLPQAFDDRSEGNAPGTAVTVDPLANDAGDLDPTTVEIRDPQTGDWGKTVVVPGEGTWTVDPVTGAITFTPERGFTGDPTPITYRVTDVNGETTQATVTIDYAQAVPVIPGLPHLPQTGAQIALWSLVAGLGLLLAGAAAWLIRRRRTDATDA